MLRQTGNEEHVLDRTAEVAATIAEEGLRYVSDSAPGYTRKRTGTTFSYYDKERKRITDPAVVRRIKSIGIPPAYESVWICPSANGHIQATGLDARGRKQYRYHARWREQRDSDKYGRLVAFGRALPRLRRKVEQDLARRGLPREKVLAAVVQVMERTLIRVGNDEYAQANRSFGLTTLRDGHATIGRTGAVFEFRGKAGKVHKTGFNDRRLARIVKACQDVPGQRLFQYVDEEGQRRAVQSADVNAYIRDALGDDFSAKDFRTWAGTVMAARALVELGPCATDAEGKRNLNACVKAVAGMLGNTAAVARKAYIHPAILDAYAEGRLDLGRARDGRKLELAVLHALETATAEHRAA